MKLIDELITLIGKAPTMFHAASELGIMLKKQGFEELSETDEWALQPGRSYYILRNGSAVIAFSLPKEQADHFQIVASHSDSPMFKLKTLAEETVCGRYLRLNTECYGGPILSTWLDRPLSVAGRLLYQDGNAIRSVLTDLHRDAVLIPNLPIHFNRDVNKGYAFNLQTDMLPLFGGAEDGEKLMGELAKNAGIDQRQIVGSDLYLYSRSPASVWGADNQFISCNRLDDMECAFTSVKAIMQTKAENHINVCAVFDNEEVGSASRQGADSTFLEDVLFRIGQSMGWSNEKARAAVAGSFMVSADNAHAVHPNHSEKYDADNRVYMNGGVVIKHNATLRYVTDGLSSAVFETICKNAGVRIQHFANRSDTPGGGTLGNISNTHLSMCSVDIGLAQLAMHSAYETAGVEDVEAMVKALSAFYTTDVRLQKDGSYSID